MILVRKGSARKRPQPCGWSLILPAQWVTPFWQALIFRQEPLVTVLSHHNVITCIWTEQQPTEKVL